MPDDVKTAPEAGPRATSLPDTAVMRGVIPYLALNGRATEAADFYMRAFGARDLGRMPDENSPGTLMHCQVEINGGSLMMTNCRAPGEAHDTTGRGLRLQLVVADGDAWWNRAVAAGCTVVIPFERMFWGDRWGMMRDPFGIEWAVNEPAEQPA